MKKIYKKLTQDQVERGVIFSSTLSHRTVEGGGDTIHEVFEDTVNKNLMIERLKDISFFKNSPWKYCIERQGKEVK